MTTTIFICGIGFASLATAYSKGLPWAFRWIVLPVMILVPYSVGLDIGGLPDPTARRVAYLGVIVGSLISGRADSFMPRWRWFDLLALIPVLSFSVTYGMDTDLMGFVHRLMALTMDWAIPYLLARAVLRDIHQIRAALAPLAYSSVILAGLAVYECRMATRLATELWNAVGVTVPIPRHSTFWRWGYLRASAGFEHPITMGTFFTTLAPLMVLWGLLEPKMRAFSWVAALSCVAGCVASLSRGPWLVLGVVAVVFWAAAVARRTPILLALVAFAVAAGPLILDAGREEAQFVQTEMDYKGNVTSGHYRFALLLIYGEQALDAGLLGGGGQEVQASLEYEQAWSIDNAYLFLFLTGGWLGGGSISLIVMTLLYFGCRRIVATTGFERKVLSAATASFAAMAGCMANVWFAPSYAPLFWITGAMLLNLSQTNPKVFRPDNAGTYRPRTPTPHGGPPLQPKQVDHQSRPGAPG